MAIKSDTFTGGGGGGGAVTSVNGNTGAVTLSGDDLAADHTASNYTAANANIDGHLSGIDTKLGTLAAGLTYKGTFNATTGAPSITNALQGDLYIIGTAGTIYGQTWAVGDHLLVNADMGGSITNSKIDKIDNTEPVNVLLTTNNLSDLDNAGTARTNLGLGTAATSASSDFLAVSDNLSDLNNVGTARTNLGLGTAATSASTDFLAVSNNLSDLNSAATARTNLGLGTAATQDTGTGANNIVKLDGSSRLPAVDGSQLTNLPSAPVTSVNGNTGAVTLSGDDLAADHTASNYTAANANIDGHLSGIDSKFGTLGTASTAASSDFLAVSNNLSDLNNAGTARTNLGLGTAATQDTGTGANNIVKLDGSSRLPAVDGSQLTGLSSAPVSSVNGNTGAVTLSGDDLAADHTASNYTAANANIDGHLSGIDTKLGTLGGAASESAAGIIEIATNAEATAATAPNKALVPSNISSLELSDMSNTTSGFISNLSEDTTPQLGGNLDVNGQDIVSVSNGDIELAPDGNGSVKIKGNATSGSGRLVLNCEQNSHGITLKGPPHSAAASYTLTFPNTDGNADQVLKTDGSGALDWVDQASGGGWTYSAITANPANAQAGYHYSCTGTFTITLPTSGVSAGAEIRVKNMGSGTVTIDPQTQNIDGATTDYTMDVQYSAITLVSTGSHWEII